MSEMVAVNGIIQSTHQYMKVGDRIIFHQAPPAGSTIYLMTEEQRYDYEGDGVTYAFPWPLSDRRQYKEFMEEVYQKRNDPTVKDLLEKLKIVMELLR